MLEQLGVLHGIAEDLSAIREALTGEMTKEKALQAYLRWVRTRCGYLCPCTAWTSVPAILRPNRGAWNWPRST